MSFPRTSPQPLKAGVKKANLEDNVKVAMILLYLVVVLR
jgi:hypothetical protein